MSNMYRHLYCMLAGILVNVSAVIMFYEDIRKVCAFIVLSCAVQIYAISLLPEGESK